MSIERRSGFTIVLADLAFTSGAQQAQSAIPHNLLNAG
jgi:hypothetical protein